MNRSLKGTASTCNTALPWLVPDDKALVSLVVQEGGESKKTIMSISEVMCWVAKQRGVTEAHLHQHEMRPQMKVGYYNEFFQCIQVAPDGNQEALAYRYLLTPNTNIHAFEPKVMEDFDRTCMRSTQLGVIYKEKYNQVPSTPNVRCVWEAGRELKSSSSSVVSEFKCNAG